VLRIEGEEMKGRSVFDVVDLITKDEKKVINVAIQVYYCTYYYHHYYCIVSLVGHHYHYY